MKRDSVIMSDFKLLSDFRNSISKKQNVEGYLFDKFKTEQNINNKLYIISYLEPVVFSCVLS